MSAEAPVPRNAPVMVAWETYVASEDYANSERWARTPEHTKGSMWAAFVAGYMAAGGKTVPEASNTAQGTGWQPIETAPKDGTPVDLCWPNGYRLTDCFWGKPDHCCGEAGQYCDDDWHWAKPGWVDSTFQHFIGNKPPTHWMPIPSAPSPEINGEGK